MACNPHNLEPRTQHVLADKRQSPSQAPRRPKAKTETLRNARQGAIGYSTTEPISKQREFNFADLLHRLGKLL
jgi:hypothetical protein